MVLIHAKYWTLRVARPSITDVRSPRPRSTPPARRVPLLTCIVLLSTLAARPGTTGAGATLHGLWVWKSASVFGAPRAAETLRDFCQANAVTEVYVSVGTRDLPSEESELMHVIDVLHRSGVRVEALLSSTDADEPGKPRDKLLQHVQAIVQFNREHAAQRFDGIHLDIEPQQRPENKGTGNLRFLRGLAEAYRAVRAMAEPAHLTVNGDIQNKLLKGTVADRQMLLSALPRFTLMLYELSNPADATPADAQAEKLRQASRAYLEMAYQGLDVADLGVMAIALRTPDYGERLPAMLAVLDETNHSNAHYAGWARHSYNDYLAEAERVR
jgi:hypothetical protein